jgi:hypothetical protein
MVLQLINKSQSNNLYFFILRLLVESKVEVKDCLLEKFGEIDLLSVLKVIYLYSLTMTVSEFLTNMMSLSPL